MEDIVKTITTLLTTGIDLATGLIIGYAIFEALVKTISTFVIHRGMNLYAKEVIRLELGKWLALSLEFSLASDILRSVIAPTWDDIGKLAAIIALRTILNFFLQREIEQGSQRHHSAPTSLHDA